MAWFHRDKDSIINLSLYPTVHVRPLRGYKDGKAPHIVEACRFHDSYRVRDAIAASEAGDEAESDYHEAHVDSVELAEFLEEADAQAFLGWLADALRAGNNLIRLSDRESFVAMTAAMEVERR